MDNEYYDKELHVDLRNLQEVKEISTVLDTFIDKIKSADNYDDFLTAAASFYDLAYRRGYDDGLNEVGKNADSN